jgi:hypothetical protein
MKKIDKSLLEELSNELDAERTGLDVDRVTEIKTLVTHLLKLERDMLLASTAKQARVDRILIEIMDSGK